MRFKSFTKCDDVFAWLRFCVPVHMSKVSVHYLINHGLRILIIRYLAFCSGFLISPSKILLWLIKMQQIKKSFWTYQLEKEWISLKTWPQRGQRTRALYKRPVVFQSLLTSCSVLYNMAEKEQIRVPPIFIVTTQNLLGDSVQIVIDIY